MKTVCDGCGKELDRSGVQGSKDRHILKADLGICWECAGSGSWAAWTEPGFVPARPIEGLLEPIAPILNKVFARFLARQEKVS